MRVRSSDEENEDIMDVSEALILAEDNSEFLLLEDIMAAVKKVPSAGKEAVEKKAPAAKKVKVAEGEKAKGVFGPRVVPEGFVGLNTLATELGITPAVARRKLRGMEGMTKPAGHGWCWKEGSKDLNAVRKALTPSE